MTQNSICRPLYRKLRSNFVVEVSTWRILIFFFLQRMVFVHGSLFCRIQQWLLTPQVRQQWPQLRQQRPQVWQQRPQRQRRVITAATKDWLQRQRQWQQRFRQHRRQGQRLNSSYDWRRQGVKATWKTAYDRKQQWRLQRLLTVAMMTATTNNEDKNSLIMYSKFILLLWSTSRASTAASSLERLSAVEKT